MAAISHRHRQTGVSQSSAEDGRVLRGCWRPHSRPDFTYPVHVDILRTWAAGNFQKSIFHFVRGLRGESRSQRQRAQAHFSGISHRRARWQLSSHHRRRSRRRTVHGLYGPDRHFLSFRSGFVAGPERNGQISRSFAYKTGTLNRCPILIVFS